VSAVTEIGFYHLTRTPLERALPKILEKVLASGARAVVRAGSGERVAFLDGALWTYRPDSFLPHGSARDGEAAQQPIWLTTAEENPNGATILVLTDGTEAGDLDSFERCVDMFDGNDVDAVDAARARWTAYKDAGHALAYWQQNEKGGWEQNG
jgi:DNA polymerase-3 subunit chi